MSSSPGRFSRRRFLRRSLLSLAQLGAAAGLVEAGRKGLDLVELHETWAAAAAPNPAFLAGHAALLAGLEIGASFAPEQWPLDDAGAAAALGALDYALHALDMRQLRFGIRWRRAVDDRGRVDLAPYAPYLDYALANDAEICLNVGPVRTFRWPEEHVPDSVRDALTHLPPRGGSLGLKAPLAQAALAYLEELLFALRREYGAAIGAVQVENEPFYPLGEHAWRMSPRYLLEAMRRVDAAFPTASLLVTSAGRLNLHDLRDLFVALLATSRRFQGRLVSGFDYHFKTPRRDSFPVIRYFDQIAYAKPFAPGAEGQLLDARAIGYRVEVTEGQAEPYSYFTAPGNSAKDFRFLLLRCLEKVLDPDAPKLIRIWGLEELAKKARRGALTREHDQIVALVQTLNAAAHDGSPQVRSPGQR